MECLPRLISSLEFGAFLAYSPHGTSTISKQSRQVRDWIKFDRSPGTPPRNAIAYTIDRLRTEPTAAALRAMLSPNVVLVPCPGSNPLPPAQIARGPALWTPRQICRALVVAGMGSSTLECLRRVTPVQKSAFAAPGGRPSPQEHYDSIASAELPLASSRHIVLVDDFVTKGATLLGRFTACGAVPRGQDHWLRTRPDQGPRPGGRTDRGTDGRDDSVDARRRGATGPLICRFRAPTGDSPMAAITKHPPLSLRRGAGSERFTGAGGSADATLRPSSCKIGGHHAA